MLQSPIAFKLCMKYPKIPFNSYSDLEFSISACGNCSSQNLIYWDTEWWNTVATLSANDRRTLASKLAEEHQEPQTITLPREYLLRLTAIRAVNVLYNPEDQ